MDKKIANNLVVGFFLTAGIVGFVFILFNIGNGSSLFSSYVTLYAKYPDVKGLHYGSEVALSGLRAGVVKGISVSKEDGNLLVVELSIAKNLIAKIRKDSIAAIRTQGMLGDKYIEVSIGSPDAPEVQSGDFLVTTEAKDLFTKSGNLVDGISRTFDKGGDLDSLLKNLNKVTQNLVVLTGDIQKNKGLLNTMVYGDSGTKLDKSLGNLEEILRKINSGEGTLGALVNDPTLYEDVKYLMGGAKRSNVLKYFMRSFIESGEEGSQKTSPKK